MPDIDFLAPNYRRAKDRWPDAPLLQSAYDALVECYEGKKHGLVEHAKSYVECVCVTILADFGQVLPSSKPSTTDLLVAALHPLGMQNSHGANKIDKVLSAFNRLTVALSEARNEDGPVAHGRDGFLDLVSSDHSRAFLHAADAILSILLNAHEGTDPDLLVTREPFERFSHLNERIDHAVVVSAQIDEDEAHPVFVLSVTTGGEEEAIELRAEPSRLLYEIDRPAYIEVLRTVRKLAEADREDTVEEEAGESELRKSKPPIPVSTRRMEEPIVVITDSYKGQVQVLRRPLEDFLKSENIDPDLSSASGTLLDSLLATLEGNIGLDWETRETIQSRIKVGCKRVFMRHGIDADSAEEAADRLLSWLKFSGLAYLDRASRESEAA